MASETGPDTVQKIVSKTESFSGEELEAHINSVARYLGVKPDTKITVRDHGILNSVVREMKTQVQTDIDVDAWNAANPLYALEITGKLLNERMKRLETTREERMVKRAPKAMREGVERRFDESKRQ